MSNNSIIPELRRIVGNEHVLTGDAVAERAAHFWNPAPLSALALVRPKTTEQVSQILSTCNQVGQAVVTHGGVTGLAEGEKSTDADVILSLERMRDIESLDVSGRTITVQAGCVLQAVQEAVAPHQLQYGVDLGARGSCTIGGNIATNAGGLSVLRYGMTREQVLGLEAVLADGTVLNSMNAMMKNNTGYDLKQLFIGSEGTLAVITRAVLRLRPATPSSSTALVAYNGFDQVTRTLSLLSSSLNGNLNAFEVMWNEYYQLSTDSKIKGTSRAPLSREYPLYTIIESRGTQQAEDEQQFHSSLERAMEQGLIDDAVIAKSDNERADIWQIRENVDLMLRHQPVFVYDISLPIATMDTYLQQLDVSLKAQWSDAHLYAYGHMADGNLHIGIAPQPEKFVANPDEVTAHIQTYDEEQTRWYQQCNKLVFEPLSGIGGSISAEHGIGLLKKHYLPYSRTTAEIDIMRQLKQTLDPNGILNPGKIV